MAAQAAFTRVSIAEYLERELVAESKHELHEGQVYAMSGASSAHARISANLTFLCMSALGTRPCEFLGNDIKVVVAEAESSYYPDGNIACPPNWLSHTNGSIDNPTVIFEILSPSTEGFDRGLKFDNYALLPSLREYVLIHTRSTRVDVFTLAEGGSWRLSKFISGAVAIESVGIELPLTKLYERVTFADSGAEPPTAA